MEKKYLLVHTWLDTAESEQKRRQVWKSRSQTFSSRESAYFTMKYAYIAFINDNKVSLITCCFGCDSAYVEYADSNREIWTITTQED